MIVYRIKFNVHPNYAPRQRWAGGSREAKTVRDMLRRLYGFGLCIETEQVELPTNKRKDKAALLRFLNDYALHRGDGASSVDSREKILCDLYSPQSSQPHTLSPSLASARPNPQSS